MARGAPRGTEEIRFRVRLTPRGGVDRIDGVEAGVVRARVAAAPVNGAANDALVRLIADALDVAPSSVRLVSGASGRVKVLAVEAETRDRVRALWPDLGV